MIWDLLSGAFSFVCSIYFPLSVLLFSPVVYLMLNNLVPLLGPQDLKKKYNAKWALVTGCSSGIGKELARKMLYQELDLIMISRAEPMYDETEAEFRKIFPQRNIVRIDANLSDESGAWMEQVKKETAERDVQVVWLNAGYIVTGFFEQHKVEAQLANLHCNLTSNIFLTHHLYQSMLKKGLRGCIVFTSSSASYLPNPFACMYATTKAAVSSFAASLACESRGVLVTRSPLLSCASCQLEGSMCTRSSPRRSTAASLQAAVTKSKSTR